MRTLSRLGWTHWAEQLPISTTVLVVEDNATVRECLRELLADGGRVGNAVDAAEALGCMAADGAPDVPVTDMQLGSGMNGLELIAVARLRWPEVHAVLLSGTNMTEPVLDPADRSLHMPFTVGALTRAVWELATRQDKLHAS